jgi:methionyl-tRNA synthetase
MFPAKNRRNITIDGVLWHYLIKYEGVTVQNTETNELIDWNAGFELQISPALVAEVIKTKGKPEGFGKIKPKKFITTTLPYANSVPHIGHAFEFILGDSIARYYRAKLGDTNVHFNVGLDEHGKKIHDSATDLGITPEQYLVGLNHKWKQFCSVFSIEYNSFYRTSHSQHIDKVKKVWIDFRNKGLIYKRPYVGTYCVGCESFKLEKDLVDNKCQDHPNKEVQQVEEENYFFALSKYKKQLLKWFESTNSIKPESKREELRLFLEDLQDISISRKRESVPWGVSVPDDSSQVVYVWFDALLNYIISAGYFNDKEQFEAYWSESIQIFGPDNLKFQAAIFQGLLCALDINQTNALLCHGTIVDKDGKKMSKTVGNVIDPLDQLEKFGVDAVRFYALSGLNTYGNSSWSEEQLVNLYNSHLADNYGNLLARVTHLASKREDWNIYAKWNRELFEPQFKKVKELWEKHEVSTALHKINDILSQANKYITDKQPWDKNSTDALEVLVTLYWCLRSATEFYAPVIPEKANQAESSLKSLTKIILFPKLELEKKVAV